MRCAGKADRRGKLWRYPRVLAGRCRDSPLHARVRRECATSGIAGSAVARQFAAQRTGPRRSAEFAAKTDPGDQCRGKLDYGRRGNRSYRQRLGTIRTLVAMDWVANTPDWPGEQGFGKAEGWTSGTHQARARAASLFKR